MTTPRTRFDGCVKNVHVKPVPDKITAGDALIITCEHGGREVPPEYAHLFTDLKDLLETHRGWDPGALVLAQELASTFAAPLFTATTTRLLIDLNRSIGHKRLYSQATHDLPRAARGRIVTHHYRPYRDAVAAEVARQIALGKRVTHIASHSFTPELGGVVRQADVAWLYNPGRSGEGVLARHWQAALRRRRPDLKLRRNYPYKGKDDGQMLQLRRCHSPDQYLGLELEVNHRFALAGGDAWTRLRADIIASLADVRGL